MNATLQAFAALYRNSISGRRDAVRDYTIEWERFLRTAGVHDGEEREQAIQELVVSERQSGGLLVIDRHPRSGQEQRLRLRREGGEAWLFSVTGLSSPKGDRESLADFFRQAQTIQVPEALEESWQHWLDGLAGRAMNGGSIQPFKRDDPQGNAILLDALTGVLNWKDEALIRFASTTLCGDSKTLERLGARLTQALREITLDEEASLERFGISNVPRSVLVHGPLWLDMPGGRIDFGLLDGPVAVSGVDLDAALDVGCGGRLCLTVENEGVFRELAKRGLGLLLVHTSFPGAATRRLFERLPQDLDCLHFGDSDPAGFDILRDLRQKTGRSFRALAMEFRPASGAGAPRLTDGERKCIERLLLIPQMSDIHDSLHRMLADGSKGDFEQETLPVYKVIERLGQVCSGDRGFSD